MRPADLPVPGPQLLGRIRAHAAAGPGRPAVTDARTALDYAGLVRRIGAWSAVLTGRGVMPGDRVGLHLENSADYVVAVLAVLSAGAVFVPVPFTDPADRVRRIARDCQVRLTVVPDGLRPDAETAAALRPLPLSELSAAASATEATEASQVPAGALPAVDRRPQDLVYLVYTSGSSGEPKGVMIRWSALENLVANTVACFGLTEATRALCVSPFHFDGAFGSLFSVLSAGGSLVVAGGGPLLPADFFGWVVRHGITHTSFSPTLLRLLIASRDLPELGRSQLRTVGLGGEDCTPEQVAALLRARPQLRVFNRYGPTETTVVVASHLIDADFCATGRKIPIGGPDRGVSFHLVDTDGRLITEPGVPGELYVGGVQVMAGYWGAPELTSAVLRDDVVPGTLLYRTGDLVERDQEGRYLYRDRVDHVVKRGGNRISMIEIRAALLGVPGVRDAVSIVDRSAGRPAIRAFVEGTDQLTVGGVRAELLHRVPGYMNPDSIQVLAALPRLSSGKPDLRRLAGSVRAGGAGPGG